MALAGKGDGGSGGGGPTGTVVTIDTVAGSISDMTDVIANEVIVVGLLHGVPDQGWSWTLDGSGSVLANGALPTMGGNAVPWAINDNGAVVGVEETSPATGVPVVWTDVSSAPTALPVPPDTIYAIASGINNDSIAVGAAWSGTQGWVVAWKLDTSAAVATVEDWFVVDAGDVGVPAMAGGANYLGYSLNDIAFRAEVSWDGITLDLVAGSKTQLFSSRSTVESVNDNGAVSGSVSTTNGTRAFAVRIDGSPINIPTPAGGRNRGTNYTWDAFTATEVNNSEHIVALVFRSDTLERADTEIVGSKITRLQDTGSWDGHSAWSMNNDGWIGGRNPSLKPVIYLP